jgi:hypothetical protein
MHISKKTWENLLLQIFIGTFLFCFVHAAHAVDCTPPTKIDNTPVYSRAESPPPLIMFILDDSGSMDYEIVTNEREGTFNDRYYVFDDPGDNQFDIEEYRADPRKWKVQWAGLNKLYYNPAYEYKPWPDKDNPTNNMPDANTVNPESNPYDTADTDDDDSVTFNLGDEFYAFEDNETVEIIIDNTDEGFTLVTDNWTEVPDHPEGYNRNFYHTCDDVYCDSGTSGVDYEAQWAVNLPAGTYEVYVWYRSWTEYNTTAWYTINYANGGSDRVHLNQRQDQGQWNLLGEYVFDGDSSVVLSNNPLNERDHVCADAVKFERIASGSGPSIKNAHYYTWDDKNNNGAVDNTEVTLVNFVNGIRYYYVLDEETPNGMVDPNELRQVYTPPDSVSMSAADDLQNFANWYTYYRRRIHTAKAAVGRIISQLSGAHVGVFSIAGVGDKLSMNMHNVKVDGEDDTDLILGGIYGLWPEGGTDLRDSLGEVGWYFYECQPYLDEIERETSPWYSRGRGGGVSRPTL